MDKEFTCDKFGVEYEEPEDFSLCNWQTTRKVHIMWIVYRAFIIVYCLCCGGYTSQWLTDKGDIKDMDLMKLSLLYLYSWTSIVAFFALLFGFVLAILQYRKQKKDDSLEQTNFVKAFWVLYTVALPCTVLVCSTFWIDFGPYYPKDLTKNGFVALTYICPAILFFFDYLLVAFPYRIYHIYMPFFFLMFYAGLGVFVFLGGEEGVRKEKPVYEIPNYEDLPCYALYYVIYSTLILLGVHLFLGTLYLLKLYIRKKYILKEW